MSAELLGLVPPPISEVTINLVAEMLDLDPDTIHTYLRIKSGQESSQLAPHFLMQDRIQYEQISSLMTDVDLAEECRSGIPGGYARAEIVFILVQRKEEELTRISPSSTAS